MNGEFNYINNNFTGNTYSPVAYQMLEGLQPNINLTWRFIIAKEYHQIPGYQPYIQW